MGLFTEREKSIIEALADLASLSDHDLGQAATLMIAHMRHRFETDTDGALDLLRQLSEGDGQDR